ncbi:YeeE/YedE thiosulfate transporter family protein [Photobacterium sp.]|uniref:YeeE/YedE thiosulfate transporter family protein n=1 Tax=Photobacterium sp. TaxID=660 RepID=UPI00299F218D|nr:YeeE/YedE thiosulfate transporter family protein [Photobacterium sp.]MDX1302839.1 YeeE/YedE thiosulfate transporter family protein [Photobacterium sp.]
MIPYAFTLLLACFVGILAQKTGLCMVRGVQEFQAKRPGFLLTTLCCGFWLWLVSPISDQLFTDSALFRHSISFPFFIGGLLFGLGSAMNKGCAISTISKLAKGHYQMIATLLGWLIGWILFAPVTLNMSYTTLAPITSPSITVTVMLFLLIALIFFRVPSSKRPILLGVVLFGIIASLLTSLLPNWSPSELFKDIAAASIHGEPDKWPSIQRYLVIVSLIIGMAISARKRLNFREFQLRPLQLVLHLCAGIIMGIGASLALGGNDSQLFVALPAFSPAAALTVISMLVGTMAGIFIRKKLKYYLTDYLRNS